MKGVLSRTIWTLVLAGVGGVFAVMFLAFSAGSKSGGLSILQFGALPQEAGFPLTVAAAICVALSAALTMILSNRVVRPVEQLTQYSQEVASGDARAQVDLTADDDFKVIVENFKRAAMKVTQGAAPTPEAQGTLQRRSLVLRYRR